MFNFGSTTYDPSLTVVVPTRNEEGNVEMLVDELRRNVPIGTSVIFIDDSDDSRTVTAIRKVREKVQPDLQINVLHRPKGERTNDLAGAVTQGISIATSDLVLVMDGDLQHPPATIPNMLACSSYVDLVVASRYCSGGSASGLGSPVRHVVSLMCTWAAKALFPHALRGITDPMTGFFLFRRESVDPRQLQTAGFKILLEVLILHPSLTRTQVPMCFADRNSGKSKGTFIQGLFYLRQLIRLRFVKFDFGGT